MLFSHCKLIQEGDAVLFYTHSNVLNGYFVVGLIIAPDLVAKMNFAKIWKYFVSSVVLDDDMYCSLMPEVNNTMFTNYLTYHSTIEGRKMYTIDNYLKSKYSSYELAKERRKLKETMPL